MAGGIVAAGVNNTMTDFGWEYVYHCHYLDHEENDMMRPMVFDAKPPGVPTGLAGTFTAPSTVNLSWIASNPGGAGYTLQRSTTSTFPVGANTVSFNIVGNSYTTYADITAVQGARYYYRIMASSPAGNSAWSPTVTILAISPPVITGITTTLTGRTDRMVVTYTYGPPNPTSFTLQRSSTAAFTTVTTNTLTAATRSVTINNMVRTPVGRTIYFRIRANITGGSSAWSTTATATTK